MSGGNLLGSSSQTERGLEADKHLHQIGIPNRILLIHTEGVADDVVEYLRRASPQLKIHEIASPVTSTPEVGDGPVLVHGAICWTDVVKYFVGWLKIGFVQEPTQRIYFEEFMAERRFAQPSGEEKDGRAIYGLASPSVDPLVRLFCTNPSAESANNSAAVRDAGANLGALDYVLVADKAATDLPPLCRLIGLRATDDQFKIPYTGQPVRINSTQISDQMTESWELSLKKGRGDRALYFQVLDDAIAAPYVKRNARPHIAFVSPIFPEQYGVPVYSLCTAKALHRHVRLDLVNPTAPPPKDWKYFNAHIPAPSTCCLDKYDNRLFVFGNHAGLHEYPLSLAAESTSGVCIYHDAQMLDQTVYRLGREGACRLAEEKIGEPVTVADLSRWFGDFSEMPHPLLTPSGDGKFIDVVHSPVQQAIQHAFYPEHNIIYIPHAIQHAMDARQITPERRSAARALVGIPDDQIVIASCGSVHPAKCTDDVVHSLRHLHDWEIEAHLYFVGSIANEEDRRLTDIAGRLGLSDFVHFSGRIDEGRYMTYLGAADVAVQLRRRLFGQLSGALIDCVAAALPSVAPISLAASIEAPSFVSRIPDDYSSLDIANELEKLLVERRDAVSLDEWECYLDEHSFKRYGDRLAYLLGAR